MSEELYFIKFNPVVARINLYNKLCREEKMVLDFLDTDSKTSLELIKNKAQAAIHALSREELLSLFSWVNSQCHDNHEELKVQLFMNGIDVFYEIPTATQIENFQLIADSYEKISQKNLNFIVEAENFNQFLIYGIFFSNLANPQKTEENICYKFLKSDHPSLYALAESQLKDLHPSADPLMNAYFSELYEHTKYYHGAVIKLHHF